MFSAQKKLRNPSLESSCCGKRPFRSTRCDRINKKKFDNGKDKEKRHLFVFCVNCFQFFFTSKKSGEPWPADIKVLITETFSRGYISIYFVNKSKKEKSIEMY